MTDTRTSAEFTSGTLLAPFDALARRTRTPGGPTMRNPPHPITVLVAPVIAVGADRLVHAQAG